MLSQEEFARFSNTDIERQILSATMMNPELIDIHNINTDDFYVEANKKICSALLYLKNSGSSLDAYSLYQRLQDRGEIKNVGGLENLLHIQNATFTDANIESHLKIVRQLSLKRDALFCLDKARDNIISSGGEFLQVVDSLQEELGCIAMAEAPKKSETNIAADFSKLVENLKVRAKQRFPGLPTGFTDIDDEIGCLQNSELIVVGARPGVGKTSFALTIARNVAYKSQGKVLFFSLEMSENELHERILSSISGVDSRRIHSPQKLTEADFDRIERARQWDDRVKGCIKVQDHPDTTISTMRAEARQMQIGEGLNLVIVDFLQIVNAEGTSSKEGATQRITEISRGLKKLAKELKVPVIALSQLNRELKDRQDKRPQITDLRQSGSIEQDADVVLLLHRDIDSEGDTAEVNIAKNRHGDCGVKELYFDKSTTTFKNLMR